MKYSPLIQVPHTTEVNLVGGTLPLGKQIFTAHTTSQQSN